MTLTVSKIYGAQPAIDNFDLNKVLSDVSGGVQKSQNIIDSVRNVLTNPRAYSTTPAPSAAITRAYTGPTEGAEKPEQQFTFNPLWIVGALVVIIGLVFILKK